MIKKKDKKNSVRRFCSEAGFFLAKTPTARARFPIPRKEGKEIFVVLPQNGRFFPFQNMKKDPYPFQKKKNFLPPPPETLVKGKKGGSPERRPRRRIKSHLPVIKIPCLP